MVEFFRDFIAESKRIVWPNRKDLISKTTSVIILSLIVSGIIYFMDFLFSNGVNLLNHLVR